MLKPVSEIKANLGLEPNGKVQKFFTNTCYAHFGKYVPGGDTGLLNSNVSLEADSITYKSPYAHYQYVGKLYVDPKYQVGAFYSEDYGFWSRPGITKEATERDLNHTSGTSYWDKEAWTAEGSQIIAEVQKYVNGGK